MNCLLHSLKKCNNSTTNFQSNSSIGHRLIILVKTFYLHVHRLKCTSVLLSSQSHTLKKFNITCSGVCGVWTLYIIVIVNLSKRERERERGREREREREREGGGGGGERCLRLSSVPGFFPHNILYCSLFTNVPHIMSTIAHQCLSNIINSYYGCLINK